MSEFPPGFDYETLITDEDREMRKLALKIYSNKGADCIEKKYLIRSSVDDWIEYKHEVMELLASKLPEEEFIKAMERLNSKLLPVFY